MAAPVRRWSTLLPPIDGLLLIGPVPGRSAVYAAYDYGGDGITFSYLAAQFISGLTSGANSLRLQDLRSTGTAHNPAVQAGCSD